MTIPHREYAQIHVAPDGSEDLAALEGRMGMPLSCGDCSADKWWFEKNTPDGGAIRAFGFTNYQRHDFTGLLGLLDSPNLRLTIGPLDLTDFKVVGPAAAARGQTGKPPMILPAQVDALYRALNRKRLR